MGAGCCFDSRMMLRGLQLGAGCRLLGQQQDSLEGWGGLGGGSCMVADDDEQWGLLWGQCVLGVTAGSRLQAVGGSW